MISIQRPNMSPQVQQALERRKRSNSLSELEAAMWFYADIAPAPRNPMPVKPLEAPEFNVYRHSAIKEALDEMFDRHCAYCESRYAHVVKMDVEHYRPKGAIVEHDGTVIKPGYYWLAANWENLLPSCNLCNRSNKQELTHPDGSVIAETKGKANFFPLFGGTLRAVRKGDEQHEDPLLLNPCNPDHDPSKHLLFRSDGLVEPRNSTEEQAKPRGMETIEVCALHRSTLIEARRTDATRLRSAMAGILRADRWCRREPTNEDARDDLLDVEDELKALTADLNFRAMTRELMTLFEAVRLSVANYHDAKQEWRDNKTLATEQVLVDRARMLRENFDQAGLHKQFVGELLKVARIPLRNLTT